MDRNGEYFIRLRTILKHFSPIDQHPMKRLVFLVLILTGITGSVNAQSAWRRGEMQILIPVIQPGAAGIADLVNHLHINSESSGSHIRCYVTPSELASIREAGLTYQVEITDLNVWANSFGPRGIPTGYYTVDELNGIADSLAQNFPGICTLHTLGLGTGFNQLMALKISDNSSVDENEAEVLFDGGIHGDEVGGPENMIRFARDLCLGYGTDETITNLVDNREIWIYYCVNPYGRLNMTRYNGNGIDVNRDCGYMWNGEGNSPSAFSQPETKAYRKILTDNQFVIHCSYHSGTEYISFPWSYRGEPTPDHANHDYLASMYASTSGYTNIPTGQGFNGMYAINGSTKDFGYGSLGAISWSVEISLLKQPPASQIVSYYLKNKSSMLNMVEYAGYGITGTITDSMTGQPIPATLFIDNLFPFSNDPDVGDFHKFLLPGNYQVKVVSNGYESRSLTGITISSMAATEVNIALPPANLHFARRIITCQIPGNNVMDEGFTPAAIGPPDNIRYSMGRNGFAIFDMGDTIPDLEGIEFIIYENDDSPEGYQVLAGQTMDGPWISLGNATGNHEFDLTVSGLPSARYLKIKDDGDGQSQQADAGFDLDAIEGIVRLPVNDSTGLIHGIIYSYLFPDPVPGATVMCGENSTITDENGYFVIRADTGKVEICAEFWQMFMYDCDTVHVVAGDTLSHDMFLPILEGTNEKTGDIPYMVFPNPASGFTTIYCNQGEDFPVIGVFSSDGRPVLYNSFRTGKTDVTIDTGELTPGLYILRLYTPKKTTSLKLIVRR